MTLDFRIRRPPRFEPPSMHSAPSRLHRWQGSVPAAPCPSLEQPNLSLSDSEAHKFRLV